MTPQKNVPGIEQNDQPVTLDGYYTPTKEDGIVTETDGKLTALELIPVYDMKITRKLKDLERAKKKLSEEDFKKHEQKEAMAIYILSCTKRELENLVAIRRKNNRISSRVKRPKK